MKYIYVLSTLLSFILFWSCQKEKDEAGKQTLLTDRVWKIAKVESKVNNGPWVDEVPFWPACKKDDEWIFLANLSWELTQGINKCDPSAPQVMEHGTWAFLDNETKIDIENVIFLIENLDDQRFIFSASETFGADTQYVKYTLEH